MTTLLGLMWHWMSVQDCSMHGIDKSGAVKRVNFPLLYENVRCHLQQLNRQDVVYKYGMKSEETSHVIFFTTPNLKIDESTRIILHKNPRRKLEFPYTKQHYHIYEFRGFAERVPHPTLNLYEIYVQENNRLDF